MRNLLSTFHLGWYTPQPTYYEITFDTSSQYITNTVTPFNIKENSIALYDASNPNTITLTEDVLVRNITMELADEWTTITWWNANNVPMISTAPFTIVNATEFSPVVQHIIIHKDTQGPCPNGFHIGTKDEWQTLIDALTTLWAYDVNNIQTYLKIPSAYYLARSNGAKETRYWTCRFWTSTMTANNVSWAWWIDENNLFVFQADKPGNGFSIRQFKDNPVAPDSTWTQMTTWIYWSSTLWLISIQNGSSWITISDKNLWATNVWDNWLFYQFWNNTWYTYNASPYVTSKPTISTDYWPGNYYTWDFVRVSSGNNWFNWTNNNIWWWVTDWTWTE